MTRAPRLRSLVRQSLCLVLVIVVVMACDAAESASGSTLEPTAAVGLAGSAWTIASLGGAPVAAGPATLAVDPAGRVSGSTGCNRLTGDAVVDGSSVSFGPLATTRMACEPALMDQERAVLDALAGVTGWTVDPEGRLHLTGTTEIVLEPAGPAAS